VSSSLGLEFGVILPTPQSCQVKVLRIKESKTNTTQNPSTMHPYTQVPHKEAQQSPSQIEILCSVFDGVNVQGSYFLIINR
jgi:hypothetical protein